MVHVSLGSLRAATGGGEAVVRRVTRSQFAGALPEPCRCDRRHRRGSKRRGSEAAELSFGED